MTGFRMDIVETAAAGSDPDRPVMSGAAARKVWSTPQVILSVVKRGTAKIQDLGDFTTSSGSTPLGAPGPVADHGS
jgi:hypothetical protein